MGKTYVSTLLCRELGYDYWKPVQCGDLDHSDTSYVRKHSSVHTFPERYRFRQASSPHQAAALEQRQIKLTDFQLPAASRLIVEGAGGLLVPLNDLDTIADLIIHLNLPVCVVIRDYLGCINHSLLTLQYLQSKSLETALVVFNGPFNPDTKRLLIQKCADIQSLSVD